MESTLRHDPPPIEPLWRDPELPWHQDVRPISLEETARIRLGRPNTRAECVDGPRPCPWVTCRHHIWPEVAFTPRRTSYRWRDDAPAPWEMKQSCSLDIADNGAATLEEVGTALGLTRERVRQLEARALSKLHKRLSPLERELLSEPAWSHG